MLRPGAGATEHLCQMASARVEACNRSKGNGLANGFVRCAVSATFPLRRSVGEALGWISQ